MCKGRHRLQRGESAVGKNKVAEKGFECARLVYRIPYTVKRGVTTILYYCVGNTYNSSYAVRPREDTIRVHSSTATAVECNGTTVQSSGGTVVFESYVQVALICSCLPACLPIFPFGGRITESTLIFYYYYYKHNHFFLLLT